MGGIYGFTRLHDDREFCQMCLQKMVGTLLFRGHGSQSVREDMVAMGAVQHPYERGKRVVVNQELGVIVVFEGEIYNGKELFQSLKEKPNVIDGMDPIEVLPYLYREQGIDFAKTVNGVFGMAVWDQKNRELMLYRDHLGSHSVFYTLQNGRFSFATTIAALSVIAPSPFEISPESIDRYLATLAISPPRTIYKSVMAIRPGYLLRFQNGIATELPYWRVDKIQEDYACSVDDYAGRIREIFEDAVAIRSANGGECGALVSGGVDTSAVLASLHANGRLRRLKGFSIVFEDQAYSDAPLQEIMYAVSDFEKNSILLGPSDFATGLASGAAFLDSPVNDCAYAGMFVAFQAAARHGCQYIYEGEGSDEIFCTSHSRGEYDIQKFLLLPYPLRRMLFGAFLPLFSEKSGLADKICRLLARLGMSDVQRRSLWTPVFPPGTRQRLMGGRARGEYDFLDTARGYYEGTCLRDPINIYQYGLTRLFLPDDLLFKNERMASAAGVINRTPFIDYRLVEAAFQIPARYKMEKPTAQGDGTKLIFKKAARGLVPDAVLDRKKQRGFSHPTSIWYRGELKQFVMDHLLDRSARIAGYLDHGEVKRICHGFLDGQISNDYFVNSLLILELWMRSHA